MEQRFFTSDEHHGHRNIIDFCNRPYKDVEEMTEKLIENHNSVVKPGGLVYHLGDMFWRTFGHDHAISVMKRLNGQHYYLYGNHEEVFSSKALQSCFVWCKDVENLKIKGLPNIWLSHYAHEDWNGSHRGSWHLFGHVHGAKPNPVGLKMDIGVDTQNFLPISLEQVVEIMGEKEKTILSRYWSCNNKDCKNKFNAVDDAPKICSKCGSTMKLIKKTNENIYKRV